MADHTAINEARTGAFQLRVPLQAAPINRTPAGAALAAGSGIEASAWYDTLLNVAKTVGPIAGQLLSSL